MKTADEDICKRARDNFENLRRRRHAEQDRVGTAEERIAVRDGEIAEAENSLSRIADALADVAESAVGCGVSAATRDAPGALRDCTLLVMRLTNQQAQQEAKLRELRRRLQNDQWQLDAARRDLSVTEALIVRAEDALSANGCW